MQKVKSLNIHVELSSGTGCKNFDLSLHLHSYFRSRSSGGTGESGPLLHFFYAIRPNKKEVCFG